MVQELRGLFLELDPLDTGCVAYTRLQQEMEVSAWCWAPGSAPCCPSTKSACWLEGDAGNVRG